VIDMDDNPAGAPDISGRWLGFLHTTTKHGRAWLGIHGTQNIQSIGHPTSHGCIRLRIPDAIEAFSLLAIGDPIHIVGPPPAPRVGRKRSLPHLPYNGRSMAISEKYRSGPRPDRVRPLNVR